MAQRDSVLEAKGLDDLVPILKELSLEDIKSLLLNKIENDSINLTLPDDVLQSIISYQSNVKETPAVCKLWNDLSKKLNAIESIKKYQEFQDKIQNLDDEQTTIFLRNAVKDNG